MSKATNMRLSQIARKLNVGTETIVVFLKKEGFEVENKPNTKVTTEEFDLLAQEFAAATIDKKEAADVFIGKSYTKVIAKQEQLESLSEEKTTESTSTEKKVDKHYTTSVPTLPGITKLGKVSLQKSKPQSVPKPTTVKKIVREKEEQVKKPVIASQESSLKVPKQPEVVTVQTPAVEKITFASSDALRGPIVLGKLDLPENVDKRCRQVTSTDAPRDKTTKTRKRIVKTTLATIKPAAIKPATTFVKRSSKGKTKPPEKESVSAQDIQDQIKKTLAKLNQGKGDGTTRAKYKKDKKAATTEAQEQAGLEEKEAAKTLKVTEFIAASELAHFMGVTVNEVLSTCMSLGMITSINQRLDAEAITIIADEFGYNVDFVDFEEEDLEEEEQDDPKDLIARPPIVTIMGHVDHGKTSLLDYIRQSKIRAKEAGGITQHIGAYDITTKDNKKIVFLDTPGHEAFTAMRTRGAKVTDIIVIVVAADDSIMTQTKEAISHAQVAGCPIIIAINKIDKVTANPEKVKEDLAHNNILVEDWGGKYQCQGISAKTGEGIEELLEKILLEADLLELKGNPKKRAQGTVIESFLDQGRGYVTTTMIQNGTLKVGDIILAGMHYGKVKAMTNHLGKKLRKATPSTPVQILGLGGAPQAGDTIRVVQNIKEASEMAVKKQQIFREQSLRTKTHITLDEIGRRLALGNFKELKLIIKGDVDGSIEALSDALLKTSNEEVKVTIIHKCVGAVSESDVLLAAAADAIIISFQVKPTATIRKLAEREGVELRLYSIIYDAINEIQDAVHGMLAPIIKEVTTGQALVKKLFKISKVGTIAGCQTTEGYIKADNPIRVIRDGEIVHTGTINQIKHGLEEMKQIKAPSECGIHIKNFNSVEIDDILEGFERQEIKRTFKKT